MCIRGGYILLSRAIDNSEVANFPPHVREIWLYLLRKANHADTTVGNKTLRRGQIFTSYSDILEDLSWYVGYRKESYKRHHCETAMRLLREQHMITTTKTTRGMIITICKYDYYQTPSNYETDSVNFNQPLIKLQSTDTIYKNVKNDKNNIDTNVSTSNDQDHVTHNDNIDYKSLIDYFNRKTNGVFGRCRYPISDKRRSMIRARIREHGKDAFSEMIEIASASNFLKGENRSGFRATFDWMIRPSNFLKIIEGNYNNSQTFNDRMLTYDQVVMMVTKGELTFSDVIKVQYSGKIYYKRK